ncbi:MAG: super-infection exclusion protein B [Gammaproteobacteria bacterium]
MSGDKPFWSPTQRDAYRLRVSNSTRMRQSKSDGENVAQRVDELWAELKNEERAVMRYLLIANRQSLIARHDAPVLRDLIGKGLLHYPRGVGSAWMRDLRTSYKIAPAVWRELQARRTQLIPASDISSEQQAAQARAAIEHLLEG